MRWHEWIKLMEQRAARADQPRLPDGVSNPIWKSMALWIDMNLFSGRATPRQQLRYYYSQKKGMYGAGTAPGPDHIINAWEFFGGGDDVKGAIEANPDNAPVLSLKGPPFLRSMYDTGAVVEPVRGGVSISVRTQATMTPYDPTAGVTRPIMHYLVRGWKGHRAFMRPRWPNGVAGWIDHSKPFAPHLSGISRWIIQGR